MVKTNGIPQGSVLTDFIAEMVLGYADSLLLAKIEEANVEDFQILRYRDDYRIFVNNSQDGEKILKCLTEVTIDLGLKLKPEKTSSSSEVVRSSIKEDKLDWLYRRTGDRMLHKQLLIIHDQNRKHPNSGSISRGLQDFDERLENVRENRLSCAFDQHCGRYRHTQPPNLPCIGSNIEQAHRFSRQRRQRESCS